MSVNLQLIDSKARLTVLAVTAALFCALLGCGNTKTYVATEQLLMSDAVDATVAKLDFRPLAGKSVYLDATYVKTVKSPLLIDSDYVISSLRQQMLSAGVQLTDSREEAELIAEARLGALGLDGHNVTYGIPANNVLSSATSVFTSAPALPSIPEISFARHEAKTGAAKIAVFAYKRETRERYWQSGIARSSSNANDTWILGAGPLQRGTIYKGTRFAGTDIAPTNLMNTKKSRQKMESEFRESKLFADHTKNRSFADGLDSLVPDEMKIRTASAKEGEEATEVAEIASESEVKR